MKLRSAATAIALFASAHVSLADGDAKAGALVFRKCQSCHTATEPANRVGPSLMGVVGRPVASAEGYSYSSAMKSFSVGGKIWDEELLRQFLPNPQVLVKGTRMAFPGLKSGKDLDDLISYLKKPGTAQ